MKGKSAQHSTAQHDPQYCIMTPGSLRSRIATPFVRSKTLHAREVSPTHTHTRRPTNPAGENVPRAFPNPATLSTVHTNETKEQQESRWKEHVPCPACVSTNAHVRATAKDACTVRLGLRRGVGIHHNIPPPPGGLRMKGRVGKQGRSGRMASTV
jgi:hypothetical protein